jgi:hypothetical protein
MAKLTMANSDRIEAEADRKRPRANGPFVMKREIMGRILPQKAASPQTGKHEIAPDKWTEMGFISET